MHDGGGRRLLRRLTASLVVIGVVASFTPPGLSAASASIALSPTQARAGDLVSVSGSGFGKKAQGVISFDGSTGGMPTFQTTGAGSFSTSFRVPGTTLPGTHVVRAATSTSSASANLTDVAPTPTPTPTPTAAFSASPTSGPAPLAVAFTDTSTGSPTGWSWDFGDGSAISTLQNPAHTYAAAGTYTVTLTVSNIGGSSSATQTISATGATGSGERGVWLMDEGSGTTIVDSSGLGNTGTLTGSPLWTAGWNGLGLHLNGTSDYATVPNAPSLDIQGPITLAAWVKPERVATQYVIKKALLGTSNGYELSLASTGKVFFRLNQATSLNTYRIDSTTSYPVNGTTWMHIAATYDGTTMRLYINGVQQAAIAGPAAIGSNGQRLGIGAQPDGVSPFQGTLDEVRIWARALSATEIQALLTP